MVRTNCSMYVPDPLGQSHRINGQLLDGLMAGRPIKWSRDFKVKRC